MSHDHNTELDQIESALSARARTAAAAPAASAQAASAAARVSARMAAEGLADVSYAPVDSPFGPLLLAVTKRGLVRLAFPEEHPDSVLEGLASRISPRIVEATAPLEPARRELEEYFEGRRRGRRPDRGIVGGIVDKHAEVTVECVAVGRPPLSGRR